MYCIVYQVNCHTPRIIATCISEERANEESAWIAAIGTRQVNAHHIKGNIEDEMVWNPCKEKYELNLESLWVVKPEKYK